MPKCSREGVEREGEFCSDGREAGLEGEDNREGPGAGVREG